MGCGASNSLPYASPSPFLGNKQRVQNKKKTPKDEALVRTTNYVVPAVEFVRVGVLDSGQ